MKTLFIVIFVWFGFLGAASPAIAQSESEKAANESKSDKAANCSVYARNRAESEGSVGGGAIAGGVGGGAGGALFGAVVGGSKGAKRGAALGGGIGAVGGGLKSQKNREASYKHYYDACMRGDTY